LRNYGDLDATIARFTEKPLPAGATALRNILLAGLAQILFLDVPDHSAVDLAVASAQADPRSRRFAKLVNALLRRAAREKDKPAGRFAQASRARAAMVRRAARRDLRPETGGGHRCLPPRRSADRPDAEAGERAKCRRMGGKARRDRLPTGSLRLTGPSRDIATLAGYDAGPGGCRTRRRRCRRGCSAISPEKPRSIAAPRPAARPPSSPMRARRVTALDLSANRLKRLSGNLERLGLSMPARRSRPTCSNSRRSRFRRGAARRALFLDRDRAPSSRRALSRSRPPTSRNSPDLQARMLDKAADPGRARRRARLLQLLPRSGGGRGGGASTSPPRIRISRSFPSGRTRRRP
jgi:16S rRNA (cytosine967-C5)-methyltransferase